MHELTICLNIVRLLESEAKKNNYHEVTKVWVEIGELVGVELDALQFSFPIAALNSIVKNASLIINVIQGQAWCNDCMDTIIIQTYFNACPQCGCYNYDIINGKELRIVKMEGK